MDAACPAAGVRPITELRSKSRPITARRDRRRSFPLSGSLIAGWMITKGNNYSNANDENLQEIRANKIWLFFSLQKLVCSSIADTFFAFMGTFFAFSDTYLQKMAARWLKTTETSSSWFPRFRLSFNHDLCFTSHHPVCLVKSCHSLNEKVANVMIECNSTQLYRSVPISLDVLVVIVISFVVTILSLLYYGLLLSARAFWETCE